MEIVSKPWTEKDKEQVLRFLDGNINRICTSDDPNELVRQIGFAMDRLCMLAQNRCLQIKEENKPKNDKWEQLKEYITEEIDNYQADFNQTDTRTFLHYAEALQEVLYKMDDLEG